MTSLVLRAAVFRRFAPLAMQWTVTAYSAAVSLGLSILFARSMGSSAFGHYTYVYVLVSFLVLFQDAGFNTLLMRERTSPSAVLQRRYPQLPSTAWLHLAIVTPLFMLLAAGFSHWLDSQSLVAGIFCFACITLTQWQSSWFKGAGQFQQDAFFLFCGRTVSALLVVAAVVFVGATPAAIFWSWGIGLLITLGWFYKSLPALVSVPLTPPIWAYRSSISFFAVGVASTLYHQIDIVILRNLLGEVPDIGHYAVAARIHDGLLMLAMPVALMLFRRMRMLAQGAHGDNGFTLKATATALLIGVALSAGGWVSGPWIVGLLFGTAYGEGVNVIVGLLFTALIFALPNYILEQSAIATQRERWFAGSLFFAVVANVLLNLYLIPLKGVEGAAWATLLTEFALFIALSWGQRQQLFSRTCL